MSVNEENILEAIHMVEGDIHEYRAVLINTDWCVIKCQETGQRMEDLYPDISKARIEARERINELEMRLKELNEQLEQEEVWKN